MSSQSPPHKKPRLSYPLSTEYSLNSSVMEHNHHVISLIESFVDTLSLFNCRAVSKTWSFVSLHEWRTRFFLVLKHLSRDYDNSVNEEVNIISPEKKTKVNLIEDNQNDNIDHQTTQGRSNSIREKREIDSHFDHFSQEKEKSEEYQLRDWFHLFMWNFGHYIKGKQIYHHIINYYQNRSENNLNSLPDNPPSNFLPNLTDAIEYVKIHIQYAYFKRKLNYMTPEMFQIPISLFYPTEEKKYQFNEGTDSNTLGSKIHQKMALFNLYDPFKQVLVDVNAHLRYEHGGDDFLRSSIEIQYQLINHHVNSYSINTNNNNNNNVNDSIMKKEKQQKQFSTGKWKYLTFPYTGKLKNRPNNEAHAPLYVYGSKELIDLGSIVDKKAEKEILDYLDISHPQLCMVECLDDKTVDISSVMVSRFIYSSILTRDKQHYPEWIPNNHSKASKLTEVLSELEYLPFEMNPYISCLEDIGFSMQCEAYQVYLMQRMQTFFKNQETSDDLQFKSGGDSNWIQECSSEEIEDIKNILTCLSISHYSMISARINHPYPGSSVFSKLGLSFGDKEEDSVLINCYMKFFDENDLGTIQFKAKDIGLSKFGWNDEVKPMSVTDSTPIQSLLTKLNSHALSVTHFIDLFFVLISLNSVLKRTKENDNTQWSFSIESLKDFQPVLQTISPPRHFHSMF